MTKILLVNEQDEIIGSEERENFKKDSIYRVTGLWIQNSKGEILLAQRTFSKEHDPGKWGPAVSGTVEEGETYDSNIEKETEEELGLKGIKFEKIAKVRVKENYNYFCQWYRAVADKDAEEFEFDRNEVEALKWISKKELEKQLKEKPEMFVSSFQNNSWGKDAIMK